MIKYGFSLVELLVVMVIVGVLCAIAVPSYSRYIMRSQFGEAVHLVQECRKQIEIDYQETDQFPATAYGITKGDFLTINSKTIDQMHYNNDDSKVWCVSIFPTTIINDSSWAVRSIHIGGKRSSEQKKLIWFCGRWDTTGYLPDNYLQYLPPECNNACVNCALDGVT